MRNLNIGYYFQLQIIILSVFSFHFTNAQEHYAYFDHLTVNEGLSNNLIFDITQDSLGFIWAATQDGLNRYDGYKFKVFYGSDLDSVVSESWVSCVKTDKIGNIWYGTRTSGIGRINYITGEAINFKSELNKAFGMDALNIQNLFITTDDKILIATWGAGLIIFDQIDSTFKQYKKSPNSSGSVSENRIYSVFEDSKGNLWIGANRTGLDKMDILSGEVTNFKLIGKNQSEKDNSFVLCIEEDHLGNIWAGTYSGGLFKIENGNSDPINYDSRYGIKGNSVSKVLSDSQKNLWVCTNGEGVFRLDEDHDQFINYRHYQINSSSLNSDRIWTVMEDRNGLIWFGTLSNGINIYDPSKNIFKVITHIQNNPNSLIDSYVKSLIIDSDENIWAGTPKGATRISGKDNFLHLSESSGLSTNDIRIIYEAENGDIWFGTWGGGISIYNPRKATFRYLLHDGNNSNSLADNYSRALLEVDGKFFIGTEKGLNGFDPKTGIFDFFDPAANDSLPNISSQITKLFVDSKNNFWVGTNGGLLLFDTEKERFKRIPMEESGELFQRNRIREIFEDSKGNIWIGTLGEGFAKYNSLKNSFKFYSQEDGLSNNTIYEILEDKDGFFWLSTNAGLNRFDTQNENFRIYRTYDGLPNDEFNGGAAAIDSNGKLYFGGVEGLTYFNPDKFVFNTNIPPIEITRITVNGNDYKKNGFYNGITEMDLPHDKNFINITYTALDYSNPTLNKYKYILRGLNQDWVKSDIGNTAVFTNLKAGEYEFHVIGANRFGVWNNEGKKLSILISPPWWDTIYARILYAAVLLSIIYLGYFIRVRQIKKRQVLLEKLVNNRTQELQESKSLLESALTTKDKLFSIIAHDLKNPFTPLLGYSEMMAENISSFTKEEIEKSARYIYDASKSFYSLLENLLVWSKLQLNTFEYNADNVNLRKILDEVFQLYSISAAAKSIKLVNNIEEKTTVFGDKNMILVIFRNIVSNSIKFTNSNGMIRASVYKNSDKLEIIVEDNGVGMNKKTVAKLMNESEILESTIGTSDERGTGLGIMLVREFIKINKGKLNIQSEPGKGTKVSVTLPLNYI